MPRPIKDEKFVAIRQAAREYVAAVETMRRDKVYELAQVFKLREETVKKIWDDATFEFLTD